MKAKKNRQKSSGPAIQFSLKTIALVSLMSCLIFGCADRNRKTPLKGSPTTPIVALPPDDRSAAPDPTTEPTPEPAPTPGPACPVPGQPTPPPRKPTPPGPKPTPVPPAPPKNPVHPTAQCAPNPDGSFSPNYKVQTGNGAYMFGQGGGCILRPIREVWAVSLNRPLMVWTGVDQSSFNRETPTTGLTHYYDVYYAVIRIGIKVAEWHMDWYYSVPHGTPQSPEQVLINYHRSQGTSHIPYWEGSVRLDRVTDNVTSFVMRNQIRADSTSVKEAGGTVTEMFDRLSSGQPDWTQL